jgi:GNAT superfamily N-acetyltransferase
VIAKELGSTVGYALFRREPDHIYLRPLFVQREGRRRGIGRAIVEWLIENVARDATRIRIEVACRQRSREVILESDRLS